MDALFTQIWREQKYNKNTTQLYKIIYSTYSMEYTIVYDCSLLLHELRYVENRLYWKSWFNYSLQVKKYDQLCH